MERYVRIPCGLLNTASYRQKEIEIESTRIGEGWLGCSEERNGVQITFSKESHTIEEVRSTSLQRVVSFSTFSG